MTWFRHVRFMLSNMACQSAADHHGAVSWLGPTSGLTKAPASRCDAASSVLCAQVGSPGPSALRATSGPVFADGTASVIATQNANVMFVHSVRR
jgi:hypothetical protein